MQTTTEVITFNYQMMDSKGTIIESNQGRPVSIIQGRDEIFHPVEKAIAHMKEGTKRKVAVRSNEAYGPHRDELVVQVPQSELKSQPKLGEVYELKLDDGSKVEMKIVDDKNGVYTLDGNHPLAGVDLLFNLDIVRRRPATSSEIQSGKIQLDH